MMPHPNFQPGFRISVIDIAVLGIGGIAAAAAWQSVWWAGFVIAFVLGQFFLFCADQSRSRSVVGNGATR